MNVQLMAGVRRQASQYEQGGSNHMKIRRPGDEPALGPDSAKGQTLTLPE